jgi:hypothetical protein
MVLMSFDHRHYVPCLRWKQGEYQAIASLPDPIKDFVTPLIEVPEAGFDFETWSPKKSVDEHLRPFADRVKGNWGKRRCFVEMRLIKSDERMANGLHPVTFVFDKLRSLNCMATPVTGIDRDKQFQDAIGRIVSRDGQGLCLRLGIEDATKPKLKGMIDRILAGVALDADDCDLVLDLGAPNFEPVGGFAKLIEAITRTLPYLPRWKSFTVCGTSFPASMAGMSQGQTIIPRFEWLLYKRVVRSFETTDLRLPTFGDYAINHPDILPLDPRLMKPSATIRYAIDDAWLIIKGKNVRVSGGFEQYRDLCRTLIASRRYLGSGFSTGDEYIDGCAVGTAKTGNPTIWRKVGTNHHLKKVVSDISSFFGSSGSP